MEELAGKGRSGETRDRSRGRRHQNKDMVKDVMTSQNSSVPDPYLQKRGVLELRKIVWVGLYPGDFQEKLKNHGRDRSVCTYVCCAGLNTLNTCFFTLCLLRFIYFICLGGVGITCHDTRVVIRGQLAGVSPPLLSHGLPVSNLGRHIWWQVSHPLRHCKGPLTPISMQLLGTNAWPCQEPALEDQRLRL